MIENLSLRIGELHSTGNLKGAIKKRPVLDVTGNAFSQMGTLAHLDSTRFVVLPPNFKNWALVDDIKAQLKISKPAPKSVKAEVADE
jgi:hypothetical protein